MVARNTYIKTASGWEQIAATIQAVPQGLVPIVPTSVVNGSTTGDGLVSFSAATSVSLNGVFSGTYDQYLIMFDASTIGSNTAIGLRMRASGTDNATSGSYLMAMVGTSTSGATTDIATTGTQATFTYAPAGYAYATASITAIDPFIATPTKFHAITSGTDSGYTTLSSRSGIMAHNRSTSYDGFTVIAAGGITGTIRVYGYSKGNLTQPQTIQPYSMAAGEVSITPVANTPTSVTVTLPVGRFSDAPRVVISGRTTSTAFVWAAAGGATTTSFTATLLRTNTTATSLDWTAIQMTSSNSNG